VGGAPAGTQPCQLNSGTVTGTWIKDHVVAITNQNVNAGDFNALVAALTSNTAYANIHSTGVPNGELRGQVRSEEHRKRDKGIAAASPKICCTSIIRAGGCVERGAAVSVSGHSRRYRLDEIRENHPCTAI
jgi:hypothetical protein